MIKDEHAASLRARHAELEEALDIETHRPLPDQVAIKDIKKQKLRIKDELARIEIA